MSDLKAWKLSVYDELVADERMHDLVWRHLEGPGNAEGPTVLEMDIAAGRKYLRQCILNMSQVELRNLRERDAAALWARGARGAAAYRKRRRQ